MLQPVSFAHFHRKRVLRQSDSELNGPLACKSIGERRLACHRFGYVRISLRRQSASRSAGCNQLVDCRRRCAVMHAVGSRRYGPNFGQRPDPLRDREVCLEYVQVTNMNANPGRLFAGAQFAEEFRPTELAVKQRARRELRQTMNIQGDHRKGEGHDDA